MLLVKSAKQFSDIQNARSVTHSTCLQVRTTHRQTVGVYHCAPRGGDGAIALFTALRSGQKDAADGQGEALYTVGGAVAKLV